MKLQRTDVMKMRIVHTRHVYMHVDLYVCVYMYIHVEYAHVSQCICICVYKYIHVYVNGECLFLCCFPRIDI